MAKEVETPTLKSLTSSIKAATWLGESDFAACNLGLTIAAQIDIAIATGDADKIIALSPRLLDVLKQLHLTPETRIQGKQQDELDGSDHIGNYLRLLNPENTKSKSGTAKRGASSK